MFQKPRKADRAGVRRKSERKRKDSEVQKAVGGWKECVNCRQTKDCGGNHRVKRRFQATRHDPNNVDPCCWQCNIAIESLPLSILIEKYPLSKYREEWEMRMVRKGKVTKREIL